MPLTGELSDLSLAELIEFFCNQRKTGRLEVAYATGPAFFYLQSGSVVHAEVSSLRGIEAVYFALTLPNASFTFNANFEAPQHTINQPWTSVVLEGLRRMDEGIAPPNPFPAITEPATEPEISVATTEEPIANDPIPVLEVEPEAVSAAPTEEAQTDPIPVIEPAPAMIPPLPVEEPLPASAFLSEVEPAGNFAYGPWKLSAVFGAVILIVAVIAVPWGWYARSKAAKLNVEEPRPKAEVAQPTTLAPAVSTQSAVSANSPVVETPAAAQSASADEIAKRQREARAREEARLKAAASQTSSALPATQTSAVIAPPVAKPQTPLAAGAKKVTVQVTYDENGRVTQASGGDATALRIARQKRFPPGKAGSAAVTIPIN